MREAVGCCLGRKPEKKKKKKGKRKENQITSDFSITVR
jgi:hypothetical protein